MSELTVSIPLSAFRALNPDVQKAIVGLLIGPDTRPAEPLPLTSKLERDEAGAARLGVREAKVFLNKCSDKTIAVLEEIVRRDGVFLISDIAGFLETTPGELRGAWAGLTKRVRTVLKSPDAQLINWFKVGGTWQGTLAAETITSLRKALEERQ